MGKASVAHLHDATADAANFTLRSDPLTGDSVAISNGRSGKAGGYPRLSSGGFMHSYRRSRFITWTIGLTLLAATAFAQAQSGAKPFEPQVGQQGKDVVWVPTPQALVNKMLDMAKLTAQDYLMDLGSGDGRTVITAAKRGATAVGIEYNPDMVELSKKNAATENVGPKATFMKADLFETDLTKATVITMFLLPQINLKLRPTILNLKPGTRIVSNTFTMDDWMPDETATITEENCSSWCTALLWIVPAKADGTWHLGSGELTLQQQFQKVTGTLRADGKSVTITDGKLNGDQISFNAGAAQYKGRVNGNSMQGTMGSGGNWTATR
jgi:precorrin-6B methylase 2